MPRSANSAQPAGPPSFEDVVTALITSYETRFEDLGRTLHDDLGQVLSGVGLQLEALKLDLAHRPDLAERVAALQTFLDQAMTSTRRLSTELNPSIVERAGLRYAVHQLADRYRFAVPVHIEIDPAIHLSRNVASVLYRVAEYAFARAARSGSCSRFDVHLKPGGGGNHFELRFDSDPQPADQPESPYDRLDLLKIRYHTRQSEINLAIKTRGRSTIVSTYDNERSRSMRIQSSRCVPKGS